MRERRAVTGVSAERYRRASRKEKGRILTLLTHQTGLNRVYLAWLLRNWGRRITVRIDGKPTRLVVGIQRPRRRSRRRRRYGRAVVEALTKLWYLFDFMCGKRLAVVLQTTVDGLAELGELQVSPTVHQKLATISPATIDRLLARERRKLQVKRRGLTKPGTLLKHQIPVRTFSDWQEDRPGFMEFDTVGHQGYSSYGDFALTLNGADVATGWTEPRAVRNKARRWTVEALQRIRHRLPFPLLGIDSDNGSEFINDHLVSWCRTEHITFTRSRPNRKNDTCYVEQKNWSVVRKAVGYRRYDTAQEVELLNRLYSYLRLLVNFYYPSAKLLDKRREGGKLIKHHDTPKTPYQRVLEHPAIDEEVKRRLREEMRRLNPFELKRQIVKIQERLEVIALCKLKLPHYQRRPRRKAPSAGKRPPNQRLSSQR